MELKKHTKVQNVAGSLTTTVPAFVRDMLDLKKGDNLEWVINTKDETIKLTKKQ